MSSYARVQPTQPSSAPPPPYNLMRRVYKHDLRPIVLFFGILGAIWGLLWGISAFKDISLDENNAPRLKIFDIILGVLYLTAATIELFGMFAVYSRRLAYVKLFSFLQFGAVVMVVGSALLRVIVHFAYKSTLVNECISFATGTTVIRFGLWGSFSEDQLSPQDASDFCNDAWDHDSVAEIIWLILTLVLGLMFTSVTFAYARQLSDPNHLRGRTVIAQPIPTAPQHYNPPFEHDIPNLTYQAPPGSPPFDPTSMKPPGYTAGDGFEYSSKATNEDYKNDPFADFQPREDHDGGYSGPSQPTTTHAETNLSHEV